MSWLIGILVFSLSLSDDILAVFYLRRVVNGKKYMAAILSGLLTGLISLEVTLYITDPIYMAFNIVGSVIGTPLAMWVDDRWPPKRRRTKQGRFKVNPPAEIIVLKKEGE